MPDYTTPERGHVGLLTLNAQSDFAQSTSPLRACGVKKALPAISRLVQGFRDQQRPLFHAVRLYRPDGTNVDNFRRNAVEEGLRILMPGSLGAELLEGVRPRVDARLDPAHLMQGEMQEIGPAEWAFYKPRWGAFYGTTLEQRLKEQEISTLVICGCNFATTGRATIYEAGARDFRVILASDAVSGASEEALCELGRIGIYLMSTECCLSWLGGDPACAA
ncbi:MAG: isochorismatase family cysteine hydrolase [Pseudomonadota bacterium]